MSTDVKITKHAIQDKFESEIKTAEAKLDTLKARAETAKANAEIKALGELLTKKVVIHQKLQELKKAGEDRWEHVKADLDTHLTDFEKSLKEIEPKIKAH